jgi:hypothetical protein
MKTKTVKEGVVYSPSYIYLMTSINDVAEMIVIDVGFPEYEGVAYPSWLQTMM